MNFVTFPLTRFKTLEFQVEWDWPFAVEAGVFLRVSKGYLHFSAALLGGIEFEWRYGKSWDHPGLLIQIQILGRWWAHAYFYDTRHKEDFEK